MAKLVTIVRDMRPWRAGDDVAIADDAFAANLVKQGDARDLRPFPPPDVAPRQNAASVVGQKRYMTRAERRAAHRNSNHG